VSELTWIRVKQSDGETYYISGKYSIEPLTDSYYRWFLNGTGKSRPFFTTLKKAKAYAESYAANRRPA
jgi:hypothetical protein